MNKKIKFISISCIVVMLFAIGITVLADRSDSSKMDEWGGILKDYASSVENDDVFARGINAIISTTDIEMGIDFYKVSGLGDKEAREKAIESASQREALYVAAIKNGYSVTDEEVWEYLKELKDILYNADNSDDVWEVIDQFNSEQEYWDFQFTVYQTDLPIENYVADLEKAYMENISLQSTGNVDDASNMEKSWIEYFDQIKRELVAEEKYEIVNE